MRILFLVIALSGLVAAQRPPANVQWFPAAVSHDAQPWQPLFDNATLSLGRYRLPKGGTDEQTPHDRDEVYVVLAGKARLEAGGETRAMGVGDAAFVRAAVPHRFLDIEQDLDVLVLFSSARPASGGMIEGPRPTEQTAYPETSARGATRIFYWYGPDSAGQVAIDHGQPRWQASFDAFVQKAGGPRWRLGENFWTTLDTNIPLTLGGVEVAVGQYYCALQHVDAGLQLVLLDPAEVRKQRLDAYEAPKTTGGIVVPLTAGKAATFAVRLQLQLTVDRSRRDTGSLSIRFGPHELTAPVVMHPAR